MVPLELAIAKWVFSQNSILHEPVLLISQSFLVFSILRTPQILNALIARLQILRSVDQEFSDDHALPVRNGGDLRGRESAGKNHGNRTAVVVYDISFDILFSEQMIYGGFSKWGIPKNGCFITIL